MGGRWTHECRVAAALHLLVWWSVLVGVGQRAAAEPAAWKRWYFNDFALGTLHGQGPAGAPWLVPAGADAPQVIGPGQHNDTQVARFALPAADLCAVEHDLTYEVAMPPSGLWEVSFACLMDFHDADEIRLVVEDRNLVTGGASTGPCVQFAFINGPGGIYPAVWDGGSYNDLRGELAVGFLQPQTWYRALIACDANTGAITRVVLHGGGLFADSGPLAIPFGGSSGAGADQGMPEHLSLSLIGSAGDADFALVDALMLDEGQTAGNPPWDDLAEALRQIYRGGWPQMYVDWANSILADESHTVAELTAFFYDYFQHDYLNWDLQFYL